MTDDDVEYEDLAALEARGGGLRPVSELVDATLNRMICGLIGRLVRAAMIREARQAGWPGYSGLPCAGGYRHRLVGAEVDGSIKRALENIRREERREW